jgi:hypothetical protein
VVEIKIIREPYFDERIWSPGKMAVYNRHDQLEIRVNREPVTILEFVTIRQGLQRECFVQDGPTAAVLARFDRESVGLLKRLGKLGGLVIRRLEWLWDGSRWKLMLDVKLHTDHGVVRLHSGWQHRSARFLTTR